jgi:hypothetical protein
VVKDHTVYGMQEVDGLSPYRRTAVVSSVSDPWLRLTHSRPLRFLMLPRWRLQVGLTLAGCLLATSCTGTSGRSAAVASTSTSTTTTTTTRPPTTTTPRLSGGYLAKWSIGGMLLRLTMTGPTTVEGLAVYRFLFDDGPSQGQAAISGTVSNDEPILRLKPADTGPRGWYLGTNWSGRLDPATGGFTIDLPSPTTGELLMIEFLPATVEDYNRALRNAKP